MNTLQAIVLTIVLLHAALAVVDVVLMFTMSLRFLWSLQSLTVDKQKLKDFANSKRMGRLLQEVHPLALWYIHVPVIVYQRTVKHNQRSSWYNPRGEEGWD